MTTKQNSTYKLIAPFTLEDKDYTEITLRHIRTKDIKATMQEKEGIDQVAAMIARLSGWSYDAVDELDARDLKAIGKILEDFTERRGT
ncbi:phage tail assembly protein [Bartonella sp. WD12.1]|uniref:phage tail assembly protein n=1 Tax=Bartonella sp. WD12.1 TaxID=1933903 RepID=UPI00099AA4B8|nr:phage tail assembly protein [Bartonella sp. WD12.1]OPB29852.1 Phage tail assembly chaperone protein, E, or 41 or 14 [Bartonella sp. WD12.1]OPB30064.1 Phage tail assembly chaperone protein, E, or 41 or 14 [Bartonella sp. WD12.1]